MTVKAMALREGSELKQTQLSHQQTRRNPDFFYAGAGRSKVINQINHCIQFSPGVIALTGPTGSGRSSVIHSFVESLKDNEVDLCFLSDECAVLETEEELYRALAERFGLEQKPIELPEDLVDRVQHFIKLGLQNKRTMLIVVDDANQHVEEVLESLLDLIISSKGLSLLLSGESSLAEELKHAHSQSLLVHQIALRPLLTEEAFEFLRQFLLQQGISDESVLARKTVDVLMSKTGGNLALLVREAEHLISGLKVHKRAHTYLPIAHIVSFVVVVAITTLAFLYYPSSKEPVVESEPLQNVSLNVAVQQAVDPGIGSSERMNVTTKNNIKLREQSPDKDTQPMSIQPGTAVANTVVDDEHLPTVHKNSTVIEQAYTTDEKELLARPPGNITLQVLSVSSEKMVKALIDQAAASDKDALRYYRRGTKDKSSYVVLYGDYSNKQDAIEAEKMLPALFKKSSPWPRSYGDVQRELTQRQ